MPANMLQGDFLLASGVPCPIKYKVVNHGALGSQELIAAVPGKKIRVISYNITSTAINSLAFLSAATALTGPMTFSANAINRMQHSPVGHFETARGEALNITLTAAQNMGGSMSYIEVP